MKRNRQKDEKKLKIYFFLFTLSLSLAFLPLFTKKSNAETIHTIKEKPKQAREVNVIAHEFMKKREYRKAVETFQYVINNYEDRNANNQQIAYAYMYLAQSLHELQENDRALHVLNLFLDIYKDTDNSYIKTLVKQAKSIHASLF